LIALGVIGLTCLVCVGRFDLVERIERMTYDMRAREALKFAPSIATNLGFVFIDEQSVVYVRTNQSIGLGFGLYWPRQVYGRLVQELAQQGAKVVAMDVIFGELRPDHMQRVQMADDRFLSSDEFFALQLGHATNVILAVTKDVSPPPLFRTNALALGDITTEKDDDGILRRVKAFRTYRKWHAAFEQVEADPDFGIDLGSARIEKGRIVLPRSKEAGLDDIIVPIDADGNFDLGDFGGDKLPPGVSRKAKPFTEERAWHMGVVIAAKELNLDLDNAEVDLVLGRIRLRGPGGLERTIKVDHEGYFYVDWCIPPDHPQLTREPIQNLLAQSLMRLNGVTNGLSDRWRGKLAVVGSAALVGNDLADRGATPLREDTLLVSKHWNVANSIITNRFVQRASLPLELGLIAVLGVLAALVTWEVKVLHASALVVAIAIMYVLAAVVLYVYFHYWIPLVLPLLGASFVNHGCLVTWRVVFEQAEKRRVKSIFSKVVSPKIMNELLQMESLSLEGKRREISVMFADVRGFTELTDTSQELVAEFVRENKLVGAAAEACFDDQARETLKTVNLYLGMVADVIIKEDATLDKFIGDCVMAFWGAPTSNPKHAVSCVTAAIGAQRAIYQLNEQRAAENKRRELDNQTRQAAGFRPNPMLPVLLLGTGINTGPATAGLMGSAESLSYTVFGREVNLASRLEGASGRGRIFIGETTYQHLERDAPALAATCIAHEPIKVKGIATLVKVYEVPWRPPEKMQAAGQPKVDSVQPAENLVTRTGA
jgi:class 3 adenylate cyclase/CHASE2 domain-containing sensor protein